MNKLELFYQKNRFFLNSAFLLGILVGTIVMITLLKSGKVC